MAEVAEGQWQKYNKHSQERSFKVDDPVWLSIPTVGKLSPCWKGNWVVTACWKFQVENGDHWLCV